MKISNYYFVTQNPVHKKHATPEPGEAEQISWNFSKDQGFGSVFNQVSGFGSVFGIRIPIQECKNDPQSRKKFRNFMF